MANDLWGGEVTKEQALQALASITGQNFPDLGTTWGDPTIGAALANANGVDRGPLGSCVFRVAGESGNRCLDNLTADQARDGLPGRWDQFRSCELRQAERVQPYRPAEPAPAAPPPPAAPAAPPTKAKRRPVKPAKKKVVKKPKAPRAAKRAPAAARTKPRKKAAAKPKRRPAKAAAKRKPKRTAKKAKKR